MLLTTKRNTGSILRLVNKLARCYSFKITPEDFTDNSNLVKHNIMSHEKHELILTILNSTATKREARSYLSKYRLLEENDIYKNKQKFLEYDDTRENDISPLVANKNYSDYIDKVMTTEISGSHKEKEANSLLKPDSPVIVNKPTTPHSRINDASNEIKLTQTIRTCILRIKRLDHWTDKQMQNLGNVLRKAMSLGASPVIVIDGKLIESCHSDEEKTIELYVESQLEKLLLNLSDYVSARVVQGCFDLQKDGKLNTVVPEMIGAPIFSGLVPIISPIVVKEGLLKKACTKSFALTSAVIDCLQSDDMTDMLSVEKVVFIGQTGGFLSVERSRGTHVLVNLLQEFDDIEDEIVNKLELSKEQREIHLSNLKDMKLLLDKSPNITGLLTTIEMATKEEEKQVGKETNPIIFNILTDRPTISSSLPVSLRRTPQLNTTVVKKGIEISEFLTKAPNEGLDLMEMDKKGMIDLRKLKFLIDDSFGRDLNMEHYLNRVNNRVAGLIIAGDYEGGAIITWEKAEGQSVAYLDKLAVIKEKQGIPGIADIVFKAMLNGFREELLWRSRKNNPVNKWYFERSKANYSIGGTQWRLFYTGSSELTKDSLERYAAICSSIEPSFDIPQKN